MNPSTLYFNGLDGATGQYLLDAMPIRDFAAATRGERVPGRRGAELRSGVTPDDLASAGWGVVFPYGIDPDIREALEPLLRHRRTQATARDRELFRDDLNVRPGASAFDFISDNGAGIGPVDPRRLPYYLLLVGSPQLISYSFQYDLGVQYAVGRLHLEAPADYARYALGVVEAEEKKVRRPRRATLFGFQSPDDPPTASSVVHLVTPMAEALRDADSKRGVPPGWRIETHLGRQATKARLASVMGARATPAVVFTAGHAIGFRLGDVRQETHQGALVCSDWPGPREWRKKIPEEFYFAAHDLEATAEFSGMVTFHFACYSAGTPRFDTFQKNGEREIAPHDLVARLPQRLLSHRGGSALAVVGHIDRAWENSFLWKKDDQAAGVPQTEVFTRALCELMKGRPVGLAMQSFGHRYSKLSVYMNSLRRQGGAESELLARLWAAHYDARGYVLLGDPAARLSLEESGAGR